MLSKFEVDKSLIFPTILDGLAFIRKSLADEEEASTVAAAADEVVAAAKVERDGSEEEEEEGDLKHERSGEGAENPGFVSDSEEDENRSQHSKL